MTESSESSQALYVRQLSITLVRMTQELHTIFLIPLRRFFVYRKPHDFKRNFAYIILIGSLFPAMGRTYIGWDNDEFCTPMPTNQKLNRVRIKDAQRQLIKS